MLTLEEARARLTTAVGTTGPETVPLTDALGRSPAERRITARGDVPPFANSAMDGFAVRAADGTATRRLVGESKAGGANVPSVEPGKTVRVMTGAPLPAGADAVIPLEEASEDADSVSFRLAPEPGTHVRAAGHDVARGAIVGLADAGLTPASIGLLAALGCAEIRVFRRPRVAILSTGDELRRPGEPLAPGQIHDANGPALAAAVTEAGGEAILLSAVPDDPELIEERLSEGAQRADLIVASGGVSVGRHDHVRSVIERLGALDFWRIAVQPGKPLAFGHVGERPVVGLPGNPVSALVTFELFVRPMIRHMLDLPGDGRPRVMARADAVMTKDRDRRAYLRVRVAREPDGYWASSAGGQASSQLAPLASANALLVVPEGVAATEVGASYEALLLGTVA